MSLQRLAEERLGRLHIAVGAQAKVNCLAFSIDSTIEIRPLAPNLHIGLVDAPGSTGLAGEAIPALLELGHETLDPAHDRCVGQGQATLGHHLHEVAKAQLETQVPPNAQHDNFTLEVPALEKFVHALQPLRHRSAFSSKASAYPRTRFAPEPESTHLSLHDPTRKNPSDHRR